MKITVNRKSLIKSLSIVRPIIGKVSEPEFTHVVKLSVIDRLTVSATNIDNTINAYVESTGEAIPGNCIVDYKEFTKTVKLVTDKLIQLELVENSLSITTDGSGVSIHIKDVEMPNFSPTGKTGLVVGIDDLILTMNKAAKFVSTEIDRPALKAVYLEFGFKTLNITATNGNFLFTRSVALVSDTERNVLIQTLPIKVIAKSKSVLMRITDNAVIFKTDTFEIVSKTINDVYPNYKQVIPNGLTDFAPIDREQLIAANNSVSPATNSITNQIVYDFSNFHELLKLEAKDINRDMSAVSEVSAKYKGFDLRIAFNFKMLNTILENISDKLINWFVDSPTSAAIIRSEINETFLIMPLRLNE